MLRLQISLSLSLSGQSGHVRRNEQRRFTATIEATAPWLRFSLKTLLLLTALVAVYFGGRASTKLGHNEPPSGTWQMNFLAGHQRPVTLTALPGSLFHLNAGGVFNGDYWWKDGKLQVVTPDDKRFMGLTWQWVGNELVLTAEPSGRPAGSSYIGTRMHFISSHISTIAQGTVPVVPSMIPSAQSQQRAGVSHLQVQQPALKPSPWEDPAPGEWQVTMSAGAKWPMILKKLDDDTYELTGLDAFNGTYEVRDGQLVVVKPSDSRMLGLTWRARTATWSSSASHRHRQLVLAILGLGCGRWLTIQQRLPPSPLRTRVVSDRFNLANDTANGPISLQHSPAHRIQHEEPPAGD